jgi:putative ABC transport system permease protein
MSLHVGDSLTVNLLGREIEARIANLRQIEWTRLGINFAIVFAPGTIDQAPQTHLAAVYLPQQDEERLVRAVTDAFPNVTAIPVREALAAVTRIVATIGMALRLVALIALAAGVLVLGAAIAAGHRRRIYDAIVLKVLGATRGTVAAAFLAEFGLLGAATAIVAGLVGTIAAYALVTYALQMQFVFLPGPLLTILAIAVALTAGLGFAGTWRALGAKPAPLLRND